MVRHLCLRHVHTGHYTMVNALYNKILVNTDGLSTYQTVITDTEDETTNHRELIITINYISMQSHLWRWINIIIITSSTSVQTSTLPLTLPTNPQDNPIHDPHLFVPFPFSSLTGFLPESDGQADGRGLSALWYGDDHYFFIITVCRSWFSIITHCTQKSFLVSIIYVTYGS